MKRPNTTRAICLLAAGAVALASFCLLEADAGNALAAPRADWNPAETILITDREGHLIPNGEPSATSQVVDVSVGPGGQNIFSPAGVNIAVGDTVRWTWAGNFHSVTSGTPCTIDSQFCSPNDTNCPAGMLSNNGTVYQHTFTQAGTFRYFCAAHCGSGMTGTVTVTPVCTPPPPNMAGWWSSDGNGRDIAGGNNGALQNGTGFSTGMVGLAFAFDGVDNTVTAPHNVNQNGGSQITIDAWIGQASFGHGRTIAQKRTTGNIGGYTFETTHSPSGPNNGLQWVIMINGIYRSLQTPPNVFAANTFYHVAATYDGAMMRIYIDGIERASMAVSGTIDSRTEPLVIGRNVVAPSQAFHGLIDELEIFNRALSQPEIAAIFNAGAAGKCKPPQPSNAFSRKPHGANGSFDIDLMPSTVPGIECRTGGVSGVHQMVVQFPGAVSMVDASILSGTGSVSGFTNNAGTVTIDLTGVANLQTLFVRLNGVNDGTLSGNVPVAMSLLVGDTNGNGSVTASDIGQTKSQSGLTLGAGNFRTDVNVSGTISASDVGQVKAAAGTSLPP